MHLASIHLYPVKSCRGIQVDSAAFDALGLIGDRRFMVVDSAGKFITQRSHPKMALIKTALSATHLTLSTELAGDISVLRESDSQPQGRSVSVWQSEGLLADDCGSAVAEWLSEFLGQALRLVRIGEQFYRPILKPGKAQPGDVVSFADAYPFLIISEASLDNLNDRLAAKGEETLPMDRFRPNFVVSGCAAYAEDTWAKVQIGESLFRNGGPCARCIITTTDQQTAERGKEPLRTLATYRRDPSEPSNVNFGVNLIHETKHGTLHVGDPVIGGTR